MYVVGGIVSPRLPLIAVQDGFAVGAGARAAAPLGLFQGWTRRPATPRLYRDLPRPLRLTYPAATTARAPRAPFSHLAIPRRTCNNVIDFRFRNLFVISAEMNNGPYFELISL